MLSRCVALKIKNRILHFGLIKQEDLVTEVLFLLGFLLLTLMNTDKINSVIRSDECRLMFVLSVTLFVY